MTHIIYLSIIAALLLYCIYLRKGFVPEGYKHDSELDAMVRETATTHYPTMAKSVKVYPNPDAPKKPKKKPVKWCGRVIPPGWKKHYGKKMPVKGSTLVSVKYGDGRESMFEREKASGWEWKWSGDKSLDIIAYKVHKSPTMSKRKK